MSVNLNKRCQGCKYWKKFGKSEDCMGHCNFFFMTGKTRFSLHKKEYLALETEAERESFLRDMVVDCREREEGKRARAQSVWRLTDRRKKKCKRK